MRNKKNIIYPPQNFVLALSKGIGLFVVLFLSIFLVVAIFGGSFVIAILFMALIIGDLFFLWFIDKYKQYVLIDRTDNQLIVAKNRRTKQCYKLNDIKKYIGKWEYYFIGGRKYKLMVEFANGNTQVLFSDDGESESFNDKEWRVFSENLSTITGKGLKVIRYKEDLNGKLLEV